MTDIVSTQLTRDEARTLTDDIRSRVVDLLPRIKEAYEGRADRALGYPSWHEYCTAELEGLRVPLADRPAMVAELRQTGMSTRAIGAALGVDPKTVRNDLGSTGEKSPVETVKSLDGRERPAIQPLRPTSVGQSPTQMPARQEVADAILSVVDESIVSPIGEETDTDGDARRDAELDEMMAGTVQRFRRNYAQAARQAGQITAFAPERVAEVFAGNFTRDVNDLLNRLEGWIGEVRTAHRAQQRAGLRLVNGGRS